MRFKEEFLLQVKSKYFAQNLGFQYFLSMKNLELLFASFPQSSCQSRIQDSVEHLRWSVSQIYFTVFSR